MDLQVKKSEPVNQQSYEIIRNMIIQGLLPPGTKLIEEKLALQIGVSRTPIRESIKRLEQDGLVQGKTVVQPSIDDIRDSYEIRILLEGHAARFASKKLSDDQLKQLLETVEVAKNGNLEDAMKANTSFHDIIIQSSGNKQIIEVLEKMRALILLCRHQVVKHRVCLPSEHEEILQAIMTSDEERAESLLKDHLKHNMDHCLQGLNHLYKQNVTG